MAEQKEHGISWTDATWNPIRGCSRVSEGCRNCYAERQAIRGSHPGGPYEGLVRIANGHPQWTGEVRVVEEHLLDPLRWRRPRRIFVNSMSDLFHEKVADETIDRIFAVMALCPQHSFQVLTKRPARMREYLSCEDRAGVLMDEHVDMADWNFSDRETYRATERALRRVGVKTDCGPDPLTGKEHSYVWMPKIGAWPLRNVWLGVSVENQAVVDERIPLLLQTPAAVRWISAEPLLGPIDLTVLRREPDDFDRSLAGFDRCKSFYADALAGSNGVLMTDGACHEEPIGAQPRLNWVVVGGESGPGARPMHPDWARSLRDQCVAAGVAFHFKQWGEWAPTEESELGTVKLSVPLGSVSKSVAENPPCAFGNNRDLMLRVGKRAAGRELDGRVWDEYPGGVSAC